MSMTDWPEIACQRGHSEHATIPVTVDLSLPHGYKDLPQLPPGLAPPPFTMFVYDPERYPVDGGPYCPAHDAVSATIVSEGIWEPVETILTLMVMRGAGPTGLMIDFGSQLGWFSLLGSAVGQPSIAYDADAENLRVMEASGKANDWHGRITGLQERIAASSPRFGRPCPLRFVKIDVEGAEAEAVAIIGSCLEASVVDHLLLEVTPQFGPGYPELVQSLVDLGMIPYLLPDKARPPARLEVPERDLVSLEGFSPPALRTLIADGPQRNVWFRRKDASW